jgi:hypothetical protein
MSSSVDEVTAMSLNDRPIDIPKAQARYAALVDKKFASALSEAEQAELLRLEGYLNEIDAEFYEPIKNKLQAALGATTKARAS